MARRVAPARAVRVMPISSAARNGSPTLVFPGQPAVAGTCDRCGGHDFKRRPDDNEETVRTRMAEYRAKTAPILPIWLSRTSSCPIRKALRRS